ncbi:MAG: carbohydrate binding domain-containing protein [Bacteroidetes bacterium]|nr:carbohydrate binding domain-containing protein [Bacteroidota bacterium]
MKRTIFKIVISLFLVLSTIQANAQQNFTVSLKMPPPGTLNTSDFYNVTVTNNSGSEQSGYLTGTAKEENDGMIAKGTTAPILFKKGVNNIKIKDLPKTPDVEYLASDPKYKESLVRQGKFPSGKYEICVKVVSSGSNEELGSDCINQEVLETGLLSLMNPADGENIDSKVPVTFTWSSGGKVPEGGYTLRICEVMENQTPEIAMKSNKSFFEQTGLRSSTFTYPNSARGFEEGKTYSWKVISRNTESEVSSFGMRTPLTSCPCVGPGSFGSLNIDLGTTQTYLNPKYPAWVNGAWDTRYQFTITQAVPTGTITINGKVHTNFNNGGQWQSNIVYLHDGDLFNTLTYQTYSSSGNYPLVLQVSQLHSGLNIIEVGATCGPHTLTLPLTNFCSIQRFEITVNPILPVCNCTNNKILNSGFTAGLVVGNMFSAAGGTGSILNWKCIRSTLARSTSGSCDPGYVSMYGSQSMQSFLVQNGVPFAASTSYIVKFWARLTNGTNTTFGTKIKCFAYNFSPNVATPVAISPVITSGTWTQYTMTFTAPNGATKIAFCPTNNNTEIGTQISKRSWVDIDNVCLEAGSYVEGNCIEDDGNFFVGEGSTNNIAINFTPNDGQPSRYCKIVKVPKGTYTQNGNGSWQIDPTYPYLSAIQRLNAINNNNNNTVYSGTIYAYDQSAPNQLTFFETPNLGANGITYTNIYHPNWYNSTTHHNGVWRNDMDYWYIIWLACPPGNGSGKTYLFHD